jgi:crotonobetainyl-CoA:carnitine CoA-transferase CaiB-like acyl-CoA transferase
MDQVFAQEQLQSRDMQITMDHPSSAKPVDLVGSPLKLSRSKVDYRLPPPVEGQHTAEVLKGILGMDDAKIEKLSGNGIIK